MTATPDYSREPRSSLINWLMPILCLLLGFAIYRFWIDRGTASLDPRPVTPRGDLAQDETSTIALFKQNSPSVVNITTLRAQRDFRTLNGMEVPAGTGTGFIWDDAGHIVTNFHVVQGANGARVTM